VLLKQCLTDVGEHQFGDALIKFSDSQVKDLMGLCFFKTLKIKFFDVVEGKIVHFFDVTKLRNDKIENSAPNGYT
jgi:hypothetical protein